MNKKTIIQLLLSVVLLMACEAEKPEHEGTATAAINREVIATVGEKEITKKEFDSFLKYKRIPALNEKKRTTLEKQYLERESLSAVIEKEGVLDKDLIAAELNEFKKEMLISRYFEKFLKEKVSDEAVKNYYTANAKNYEIRKVHVAHIMVRTKRTMGETEKKAKLTTAQAAWSALKKSGDFAKVAKDFSEDTISGRKGGDLGWLKEGSIDPRFSKKVFSMKVGEVSEPFETAFGYHVVKLVEGPVAVKRPLKAVQGDIRYQLRNKAKDAELKRLLALMTTKKKKQKKSN